MPCHSHQHRFYCPTNHPNPWYLFQSINPPQSHKKNPIITCTLTCSSPHSPPQKKKKKVKLSTVVPELVTVDYSLTHILHIYHSALPQLIVEYLLTGVICEVVTPQRQNQGWSTPMQSFSWQLWYTRVANPEDWVSKLSVGCILPSFSIFVLWRIDFN